MKTLLPVVLVTMVSGCQCQKHSNARSADVPDVVDAPVTEPVQETAGDVTETGKNEPDPAAGDTDFEPAFLTDALKEHRVSLATSVALPSRTEAFLGLSANRKPIVRIRDSLRVFDLTSVTFGDEFGEVAYATQLGESALECSSSGRLIYVGHVGKNEGYGIISVKQDGTGRIVIASGFARSRDVLLQRTHDSRLFYRVSSDTKDENFVAGCDGQGVTNLSAPVESTLGLQSGLFLLRDEKLYYEAQCLVTGYMCMARVDGNAVAAVNLQISGRLMVSRSGFAAFKTTGDVVKFIDDPASPATDLFGGQSVFEVRWDQEADVLVAVTQALHMVSYDANSGVTRDFGPVVRTGQARSFTVLADGVVARVAPTESGSPTKDLKIHYADGSQDTAVAGKTDISMTGSARSSSVLYWYSEGGRTTLGVFDAVDAKDKILTTDMTQTPVLDPVGKVAYFSESAVNIYSDLVKRVRLDTLTVEDVSNLRDRYCSRRQSLYLWSDAFISIQRFDEDTKACVEDMFDLERGLKATLPGKDRISAISQFDFSAESGAVNYAGVFLGGESESLALIKPGQDAPEILHRARPGVRTYFSLGSPLVAGYLTREALEASVWQTGQDKREIKVAFGTRQFNTNVKPVDLGSGALAISFVWEDATIALHSALNGVVDGEISTPGAAVSGVYRLTGRNALMYTENISGVRSVYVWMNSAKHLVSPGASNTNVTCVQAMEGKIVCLENGTGGREAIEYDVDGKSRKVLLDTSVNPQKVQFVDPGLLLYTDSSIYIYDQTKTVRKLADVVLTSNVNFIKSEGNYLYGASAAADSSELLRLNLQTGELKSMDFADKICRLVSASGLGFAAVVTGAGCDEVRLTDESHATSKVWAGYSYLQFLGFVPGGGVITKSDNDRSIFISNTASGEVDSLVEVPDGRYVRYVGRSADLKKVYVVANSAGRNLEALYSFQLP